MEKESKITKNKLFYSIRKEFDEHPILKFSTIIILLVAYFIYAAKSNGIKEGILVSFLTWSFFVLCTPIADAGILIDFPMNLITGIKMVYSEMIVWAVAITLNIITLIANPQIYETTIILSLFKQIIYNPFPYGVVFILSAIGTFLSVYIADNLTNSKRKTKKHTNFLIKHKIIIFLFLIVAIVILYDFLLNQLGVNIPLI